MHDGTHGAEDAPWRDRVWWVVLALALALRLAALWGLEDPSLCTRDECIFRTAARTVLEGEPLPPSPTGWLPAPGYPYLMAACGAVFGRITAVRELQVLATPLLLALVYRLGHAVGSRASARVASLAVAVHPTLVFFTITTWTESVYTLLLLATIWTTWRARRGPVWHASLAGGVLGLAVLTRGVALWLFLIMLAGLLWPEDPSGASTKRPWRRTIAWVLGLVLVVAPWSLSESPRRGGLLISDATAGYVAWLGNGDFPPVTYDYAIGPVDREVYNQRVGGRPPPCPGDAGALAQDRCLLQHALNQIARDPARFVERVPLRMAQLFNPHTFLTRHLRWQYAPGIPWAAQEVLVALTMLTSLVVTLGGALAMWARARGPLAVLTAGVIAYHIAIIAGLYGTSRFRLPLEPLAILWLAAAATDPRGTWAQLRTSRTRALGATLTLPLLAWATLHYAWTGWPGVLW